MMWDKFVEATTSFFISLGIIGGAGILGAYMGGMIPYIIDAFKKVILK